MREAQAMAQTIEVDFLWECCEQAEFTIAHLAEAYFGKSPSPLETASVLLQISHAPMYFYKKGKGVYKPATPETLQAALASVEKKRQQQLLMDGYIETLKARKIPDAFKGKLMPLLHRPDKNSLEYKALDKASFDLGVSPLALVAQCGGIPSPHAYHLAGFLLEHFPKGVDFADFAPLSMPDLPIAPIQAFSIDDAHTTEIDDAFSVRNLDDGSCEVGVHIAAPALGILPQSELDAVALSRLSTVYMPSDKMTMLPDAASALFSLQEGRHCPAVSLYARIAPDGTITGLRNALEQVYIAENLRIESLEQVFNADTVINGEGDYAFKAELLYLWQLANQLEVARGKADANRSPRVDYTIKVATDEQVHITPRLRGAPIDKLVSELMIFANSTWGKQLAEAGYTAIYRAQTAGRVRMTTHPTPHMGLGVSHYTWASSPLRRAVDLLNQRQIIAMIEGQPAVYPQNSEVLFAALRDFDTAYTAYNEFQDKLERYWVLRYLEQNNKMTLQGVITRDNGLRINDLPLLVRSTSIPELPMGSQCEILVTGIDYLSLSVDCRVLHYTAAEVASQMVETV